MKRIALFCLLLLCATGAHAQSSINLAWDYKTPELLGLSGFKIYYSLTLTNGTLSKTVPVTSCIASATPGMSTCTSNVSRPGYGLYNFWVTAYNAAKEGPSSNTVQQLFDLSAPTGLTITSVVADVGKRDATIEWATNLPANSIVFYGKGETINTQAPADPRMRLSHSIRVAGLERRTVYSYYAQSVAQDGKIAKSKVGWFTTN